MASRNRGARILHNRMRINIQLRDLIQSKTPYELNNR